MIHCVVNLFQSMIRFLLLPLVLQSIFLIDTLLCAALTTQILPALRLTPVRCPGQYTLPSGTCIPAVFLSKQQLEVLQSDADEDRNKALLRDVVPVLIPDDPLRVVAALAGGNRADPFSNSITARDNGLYDNIPYDWTNVPLAKKTIYNAVQKRSQGGGGGGGTNDGAEAGPSQTNPVVAQFSSFHNAMQQQLQLSVTGLLVEVEDSYEDGTVTLGGAVIIARNDCAGDFTAEADDATTGSRSRSGIRLPNAAAVKQQAATVVECFLDEVVGLSLALDMPIFISPQLFEKVSLNALLVQADEQTRQPMTASAPVPAAFLRRLKGLRPKGASGTSSRSSSSSSSSSSGSSVRRDKKEKRSAAAAAAGAEGDGGESEIDYEDAPPAWEVFNPEAFLSMSAAKKRAILRASGARAIPWPRLGVEAVDLLLLEYMDDAVREEVMWLSNGSFGGAEGVARYNELMQERIEEAAAGRGAPVSGAGGGAIAFRMFDAQVASRFDDQDPEDLMLASERRQLLSGIGKALKAGDTRLAEQLRAEFASRTRIRADPTQAEGAYDRFLDQDSWYEEACRRAMQPKNRGGKNNKGNGN